MWVIWLFELNQGLNEFCALAVWREREREMGELPLFGIAFRVARSRNEGVLGGEVE
jgi:hypothetical protein